MLPLLVSTCNRPASSEQGERFRLEYGMYVHITEMEYEFGRVTKLPVVVAGVNSCSYLTRARREPDQGHWTH